MTSDWFYVVVIVRNGNEFDSILGLYLSGNQAIAAVKHAREQDLKEGYEDIYDYKIWAMDIKIVPE